MKYRAVLFDLDGTLLDTLDDLADAVNRTLASFGFAARGHAEVRAFVGDGAARLVERALPPGSAQSLSAEALERFREFYALNMSAKTAPYDGVLALLEALDAEGVGTAVVSNKPDGATRRLCERFFSSLIGFAIGGREGVARKPAPDMALLALEVLGARKAECLYVGDSETDVLTARNAGLDCVSVTWGFRSREELLGAGAARLVDSAAELERIILPGKQA